MDSSHFIGVFYTENGQEKCGGYSPVSTNFSINVLGQLSDSADYPIRFKVWDGNSECYLDSIFSFMSANQASTFHPDSTIIVDTLIAYQYVMAQFSQTSYCTNKDTLISPTLNDLAVTAFFYHQGLNMDSTGALNPSKNQVGFYSINVISETCLSKQTVELELSNNPDSCQSFPQPPFVQEEKVLAPESGNPDFRQIRFSQSGTIRIFNGQGILVRTLFGPANWDGSSQNGSLLPTDEYYIQYEDGSRETLTILR